MSSLSPLSSPSDASAAAPANLSGLSGLAGVLMVVVPAASWGTWSLFVRSANLPPTVSTPLIFLVMGLVALPLGLRSRRVRFDRATVSLIALSAAFDGLNMLAFFSAIAHTTIAIAVLTHYLAPILIALAAPRIDGVVARGAGFAAAIALAGLVIILEPWHAPANGAVIGALCGTASAFCYAGNTFTMRRLAARIGAARALSYHALLIALVLSPLLISHLGDITVRQVAVLSAASATIGAISGVVFTLGLLRIGSARAAILSFAEPVVAVALGALVWGEALHPIALLGGALVLGAGIEVARKAR